MLQHRNNCTTQLQHSNIADSLMNHVASTVCAVWWDTQQASNCSVLLYTGANANISKQQQATAILSLPCLRQANRPYRINNKKNSSYVQSLLGKPLQYLNISPVPLASTRQHVCACGGDISSATSKGTCVRSTCHTGPPCLFPEQDWQCQHAKHRHCRSCMHIL